MLPTGLLKDNAMDLVYRIQPSHCIDDMRWAEKRIGPARVRDAYNFRSFVTAGIPVAFGTDWPVDMTVVGGRVVFER